MPQRLLLLCFLLTLGLLSPRPAVADTFRLPAGKPAPAFISGDPFPTVVSHEKGSSPLAGNAVPVALSAGAAVRLDPLFAGSSTTLDNHRVALGMVYSNGLDQVDLYASRQSYFGLNTAPMDRTALLSLSFATQPTPTDLPDLSVAPEPKSLVLLGSALLTVALLALKRAARTEHLQPALK